MRVLLHPRGNESGRNEREWKKTTYTTQAQIQKSIVLLSQNSSSFYNRYIYAHVTYRCLSDSSTDKAYHCTEM